MIKLINVVFFSLLFVIVHGQANKFIRVSGHRFEVEGKPYHFIGANYWYGGLLGNDSLGRQRLLKELDFLASKGVTNLRVMAGAEGNGPINGVLRVEPPLQTAAGIFNESVLYGMDFLLSEMGKRGMKAVLFLSNNWEWSGGFLQYLNWNNLIADSVLARKLTWDEMRNYVSKFYDCKPCVDQYTNQVLLLVNRRNSISGVAYTQDPTIMSWELANEPRPMRPASISAYKKWIQEMAALVKRSDKNHLLTIGSEGDIGSESMEVFAEVHKYPDIDYATIHIWPKNWGWFKDTSIAKDFSTVIKNTTDFIERHADLLNSVNKPLVIEEFGLPRDLQNFQPGSSTSFRDVLYDTIFNRLTESVRNDGVIAGCNFWAFSGMGRASGRQLLWQRGEDRLGDPPMEEQGLNSVFDIDLSTWNLIEKFTILLRR